MVWLDDLLAEIEDLQRRLAEAGPTAHLTRGRVTVDVATGSYL